MITKDYVTDSVKYGSQYSTPGFHIKEPLILSNPGVRWFFVFCLCLLAGFYPAGLSAQTSQNEAEWSGNGYSIKKVVSNLTIASGVNFSYTIIFSAPAGVSSISIQDVVPANLDIVNVTAAGPVLGVNPVIAFSNITKLVTYNLTALPSTGPPSGSFTIVVKFPEGVTCNGDGARNRVGIMVNGKWEWTEFVSTTATAVDPWIVTKSIISGAVVDPAGGSCGYLMKPGDTITYRLAVMKANGYWGNVTGQQNVSTAVVKDILPAGASMLPNPNASFSSSTITWNVNPTSYLLDAANPWAYYWIDVKVVYPSASFPVNTQITNSATLTGVSCNQQVTHTSNQTCIKVANIQPNASAYFGKYLALTNRVPGCSGYYYIVFCNNGNVPLTPFNINDAIPTGITVNQVQIYNANASTTMNLNINSTPFATGINAGSYSTGNITSTVTNLQFQMTGTMPVGACLYMYVYFTVNPNSTGTVVTNCATFVPLSNSLTLPQACVQFTVDAGAPVPCLLKDICSPKSSYNPGDIVRFRLRVQNIGSASLTGSSIQDALHSNFTYVGNETYYQSSSYSPPCSTGGIPPAGATSWTGVTPIHSGNNLSWSLPSIPSNCQLFYTAACGYYGTWGIPYYYIEFDAKVDSFALPGVTPNYYKISGGNLTASVTSNTVSILVVATFGQEVYKLLSTDNGANYAASGTASPGSTARFRLNYKNVSNVGVNSIKLIDLLARDAGTNDSLIFNRGTSRGSQFDISYIGNHGTSLSPAGAPPTPSLLWATGQNICLPPYVIAYGCTATTWGSTPTKNVRMDFGTTFTLGPNKNLREDFDVGIPNTAKSAQKVCNDFAAIASASFLLNGSPQVVALTPVAAAQVCLNVGSPQGTCCDSVKVVKVQGANGVVGCCAQITTTCKVKAIDVTVTNGVLSSTSWNCTTAVPSGYVNQSSFTFAPGGCIISMNNCVTPKQTGVVVINYMVTFENGEKCEKKIELDCAVVAPSCCDSVKIEKVVNSDGTASCCAKLTTTCEVKSIDVNVTNGTLSSVSWNCTTPVPAGYVGLSSYTFAPGNCIPKLKICVSPKTTGIIIIAVDIVFANGEKCHKVLDLDCAAVTPSCCDSVKVEAISDATGTRCCAKLTTTCKVKAVDVTITNGTFSSGGWNCSTPLPTGFVGQSSYTFAPNGCVLSMTSCVNPKQTGSVVISYVIYFENGEKCQKEIKLDCTASSASCCDSVRVVPVVNAAGVRECCARITTTCKVKAVDVTVTNGSLSSTSWNCGTLPSGYIGASTFTFAPNGCVLDMTNCVTPKQAGVVVISYVVYFENGEKCEKKIELDCNVPTCCDKVKVTAVDGDGCCARIVSDCQIKAMDVKITNGVINSAAWNCGTIPSGYAGQSSYTFTPGNCLMDLKLCIKPLQNGSVVINYIITFANGEKCEKSIKLNCSVYSSCCAIVDYKLKTKWPNWKMQTGSFHVTNIDPTVPICYVEITPSPSGIFTTGGLAIDGVSSGLTWNSARIPAAGNLTPTAVNTVDFNLTSASYKGIIKICIVKCDGTRCCFEYNWNNSILSDVVVDIDKGQNKTGVVAVSISPVIKTAITGKIKTVAFGLTDATEIADSTSQFWAISASPVNGDDYPLKLASTINAFMGKHNAFFELATAKSANEYLGLFNLAFTKKLPKLGCTLFDENGNIIYSGTIKVSGSDTVTSALTIDAITPQGNMFEFINLYPNPSDGSFRITYATGTSRDVEIKVFTSTGQIVYNQLSSGKLAGIHNVDVEASRLSSGLYKVILYSDGESVSKSLVIK